MALTFYETKPKHHIGLWIFLVIVIILVGAIGWFGYRWYKTGQIPSIPFINAKADSSFESSPVTNQETTAYKVADDQPRYLTISSLGVTDARIYPEGLTSANFIRLPTNIHDVALYSKSSLPGSGGVIIIAGYGSAESSQAAFSKLSTLQTNDQLTIQTGDGTLYNYSVQTVQSLSLTTYNTTGTKELSESVEPGNEGLNLVTDSGKWSSSLDTYDHRILVQAVISGN